MNKYLLKNFGVVAANEYRGPKAGFGEAQVLKAILEIGDLGRVGRGRLANLLDLGSGEARTLIRRLKLADLVRIETNGCSLTRRGMKRFSEISEAMPWSSEVPGSSLGIGEKCFAVVTRKKTRKVKRGIEQRDAAIKAGALGALTVVFKSGKFFVPIEKVDCESGGPSEPWVSIRNAPLRNGDTVIVSGGNNSLEAEYGALSAALTLM